MNSTLQLLLDELVHLSPAARALGGAWVVVMILVPVIKWVLGAGAERIGISLGVCFQAALVALILFESLSSVHAALAVVGIPLFGWGIEFIGSRTGMPFGDYHYTDVLQPQIRRVPVIIPLAWLMMIPPAWSVGKLLAGPESVLLTAVLAGLAFMAWDLFLDPQMVSWDFWRWPSGGAYLGIPILNFIGWFAAGTVASLLFYSPDIPAAPLFLVYVVTWILHTIGQLVFWRLIVSGIVGSVAMGAFVLFSLLTPAG
ncbi:MAG: carotenoid biosynthesis protein [Spirochaetaceae bacterium]